jgi:hypothetical protein
MSKREVRVQWKTQNGEIFLRMRNRVVNEEVRMQRRTYKTMEIMQMRN